MNNLFFIHLSLPSSSRLRPHVFASTNKIDPFYSDPDPSPAPGFWMAACPYTLTHTHTHTHTLSERERESEWSSEEQNAAPSVRSSLRSWQTLQSLDTLHLSRLQPLCSGCNTTTNLPTDFILKIYFHSTFSVLFFFCFLFSFLLQHRASLTGWLCFWCLWLWQDLVLSVCLMCRWEVSDSHSLFI